MCLNATGIKSLSKKEQSGTGWKVFRKSSFGGLTAEFYDVPGYCYIPIGKWFRARNIHVGTGNASGYTTGFHVFVTRESARLWRKYNPEGLVVRKVKYRKARIMGMQFVPSKFVGVSVDAKVIVADEMLVLNSWIVAGLILING